MFVCRLNKFLHRESLRCSLLELTFVCCVIRRWWQTIDGPINGRIGEQVAYEQVACEQKASNRQRVEQTNRRSVDRWNGRRDKETRETKRRRGRRTNQQPKNTAQQNTNNDELDRRSSRVQHKTNKLLCRLLLQPQAVALNDCQHTEEGARNDGIIRIRSPSRRRRRRRRRRRLTDGRRFGGRTVWLSNS